MSKVWTEFRILREKLEKEGPTKEFMERFLNSLENLLAKMERDIVETQKRT